MVVADTQKDVPGTKTKRERRVKQGGRGGGGLASRLFNKFDSDRKYDPFADMDPVIQESKAGMEALLAMCNPVELNSLCGALDIAEPAPRSEKVQKIMSHIRGGGRAVEKKFASVLRLFWEGLLFEYLRSVGCPLRGTEHDPRHFVTRYWRRSMLDPTIRPDFVPYYLKREVKKRDSIMKQEKDIHDIQSELLVRELAVKEAETRVRQQHDYRFVLQYFGASRELHRTLIANVNYLSNEVEQLRALDDHNSTSIGIMEEQFVELETKYDRVVGGLVYRGAFDSTFKDTLYDIITYRQAGLKATKDMVREILADMEVGPASYEGMPASCNTSRGKMRSSEKLNVNPADPETKPQEETKGGERSEEAEHCPAVEVKRTLDSDKWAIPRQRNQHEVFSGEVADNNKHTGRSSEAAGDDSAERSLGSYLELMRAMHTTACTRYKNQVAHLLETNAGLAAEAVTATERKDTAVTQMKEWEMRYGELEKTNAHVERRLQAELAVAKDEAQDGNRRASEAFALMNGKVKKAIPFLLKLIGGFKPIYAEEIGVDLFQNLGIDMDRYAHVLARKRMLEADLESRAFEVIHNEQHRLAAAEGDTTEQEDGPSKKKERGRPKSRGKASALSADKSKGSSKSRSKSNNKGKGGKQGKAGKAGKKDKPSPEEAGKVKDGEGKGGKKANAKSKKPKAAASPSKKDAPTAKKSSTGKDRSSDQKSVLAKAKRSPSPKKKTSPK